MKKDDIANGVKKTIEDILAVQFDNSFFDMKLEDIGLDSFLLIRLIVLLEDKFNIVFSISDFNSSCQNTIMDLINMIAALLGEN